ncbi:MAG TPA: ImmA/IrrE family metallo-endopeptidase [Kofleriaceae bacterium]|nr:ImmA/IrrE family metallo-endopeptidase [Kofleriaceae bacterium]
MKKHLIEREHARNKAHDLLEEFGVEAPEHLQIEAFAHRLGVGLVEAQLEGARAQLVVGSQGARILLSDRLTAPEARRWSIAHELGHYVLGHPAVPAAELCVPRPRGHRCEAEAAANRFASVLLMPSSIVASFCDRAPMTLDVPMQLAETCRVPWTASAVRIIETSWRVCAFAISEGGELRVAAPSLPFAWLCGRRFWAGRPVGHGALARRFFDGNGYPEEPELVPASAWIDGCDRDAVLLEHSVVTQGGRVLTLLSEPTDVAMTRPAAATLPVVSAAHDWLLDQLRDEAADEGRSAA